MNIPRDKTFLLVSSSRSSVMVKVKVTIFKKLLFSGAFVFHRHILFNCKVHQTSGACTQVLALACCALVFFDTLLVFSTLQYVQRVLSKI